MLLKWNNLKLVFAVGLCAFGLSLHGESTLEETVSTLEQWVETERKLSEVSSQWEADKSSMQNLLDIYGEEIISLSKVIEDAEKDTSAAEVLRSDLIEQDAMVKKLEAKVVEGIAEAERQLAALEVMLPQPLQEELSTLFKAIPKKGEGSKLSIGHRIQPIVAILTQVQKFNQVVTKVDEFREFEAGRNVQTETIYFGLGGAFYVDQANENAGIGVPGPDGWQWKADNGLIESVRAFVDIYSGTQQAQYINLPVSVK
jgi:hypothetical protein